MNDAQIITALAIRKMDLEVNAWYGGEEILKGDVISTGHTITGLGARGTYAVVVFDEDYRIQ